MRAEVTRVQPDNGIQTLGDLFVINEAGATVFKCDSLELPWKDNKKAVSCIPVGTYLCKKVPASKNIPYLHISITGVNGRSGICIHKANYARQLKGCIAVGASELDIDKDGQLDVTASGVTFDKLMAILPDEFKLTIK